MADVPPIDRAGIASRASAEGMRALALCDTARAAGLFTQAAESLLREAAAARRPDHLHLLRFLAATSYFNGGRYRKAANIARRVEERFLSPQVRDAFRPFSEEAARRASPGYAMVTRSSFAKLWMVDSYREVLNAINKNPYLFEPAALATIRAATCDRLGDFEAASQFFGIALSFVPNHTEILVALTAKMFHFINHGDRAGFDRWISARLQHVPHAVVYAAACIGHSRLARPDEGPDYYKGILQHADQSLSGYDSLTDANKRDRDLRVMFVLATNAARMATRDLGDTMLSGQYADRAVAIDPDNPLTLVMRGIERFYRHGELTDLQRAVSIGTDSHTPYTLLAQEAIQRRDFTAALPLVVAALERGRAASRPILAALNSWLAICADITRNPRYDPDALFRKSLTYAPDSEVIKANYRDYKEHLHDPEPRQAASIRTDGFDVVRGELTEGGEQDWTGRVLYDRANKRIGKILQQELSQAA